MLLIHLHIPNKKKGSGQMECVFVNVCETILLYVCIDHDSIKVIWIV